MHLNVPVMGVLRSTYMTTMRMVILTMVGMKMVDMVLVTSVTGVPAVVVLSITWTTREKAALLFIWAVWVWTNLEWPTAVVPMALFLVPLMGMDLFARVDLLVVAAFLTTMLLMGTALFGSMIKTLFGRILLTVTDILRLPPPTIVASGVTPTRSPKVLAAWFPDRDLSAPFMATRVGTTVVDLKQSWLRQTLTRLAPDAFRARRQATLQRIQSD